MAIDTNTITSNILEFIKKYVSGLADSAGSYLSWIPSLFGVAKTFGLSSADNGTTLQNQLQGYVTEATNILQNMIPSDLHPDIGPGTNVAEHAAPPAGPKKPEAPAIG